MPYMMPPLRSGVRRYCGLLPSRLAKLRWLGSPSAGGASHLQSVITIEGAHVGVQYRLFQNKEGLLLHADTTTIATAESAARSGIENDPPSEIG